MTRVEIIANRSVQDDIIEGLESAIGGFYYTLLPSVFGRGSRDRKLGTPTWPEENFLVIAYVDDDVAAKARGIVEGVRARFPTEGISIFTIGGAE